MRPSLRVQLRESGARPKQLALRTLEYSDSSLVWVVLECFAAKWLYFGL